MTCDICNRSMNYTFYINAYYWIKVVGEEKFDKNVGHVCAHCTLERLNGASWYIIWNEPMESIKEDASLITSFHEATGDERSELDNNRP